MTPFQLRWRSALLLGLSFLTTTLSQYTAQVWDPATYTSSISSSLSTSTPPSISTFLKTSSKFVSEDLNDLDLLQFFLDLNAESEVYLSSRPPSTSSSNSGEFPEFSVLSRYPNKTNSAIAFSGGGSRAFVCALGYTTALRKLGLLSKVQYMAGISGGNWFVNSFIYRGSGAPDVDEFLGEVVPPEKNTFDKLNEMESTCMRSFVRNPCILDILGSFLNNTTPMTAWVDGIYETYLEVRRSKSRRMSQCRKTRHTLCYSSLRLSYGYLQPADIKRHAPFTWDYLEAERIVANNKDAIDWTVDNFNLVHDPVNEPFPLVGAALVGPVSQAPYKVRHRDLTMVEVTPISTGVSNSQSILYTSRDRDRGSMDLPVGGFVESSFFGSDWTGQKGDLATIEFSSYGLWTVEQAAAASSMAPELFIALTTNRIADYLGFHAQYFPPSTDGEEKTSYDYLLADGGDLENVSLIPMLLRGVKKIVLFMDFEVPLASRDTYNPFTGLPRFTDVEDIPAYFGIPQIPEDMEDIVDWLGSDFTRNKVFRSFHYPFVIEELQKAQATGKGAVATVKLTTVDNDWWGVKGGDEVEVTFAYLSKATAFEDLLPDNVKAAVATGTSDPQDLVKEGRFKGFPHYSTGAAEITHEQSNLLANFCAWILEQNSDIFLEALS